VSIVDLFAGPGGWDVGARELGLEPLGIEWDDAACATREAAGLRTLQADVAQLDPLDFPCDGLIASPPCQAFSMAGKGEGRAAVHHVMACVRDLAEGRDTRAEHNAACSDERTMLVVEPLRWALALRPAWLAFEQVPPVMPLWRAFAEVLREAGYNVWTGVLEAERYGVPQTRERAILMARLDGPVHPPEATHHRFVPGQPRPDASDDLFGGGLLPWVSMAEALGWADGDRVGFPRLADGGVATDDGYRERDLRDGGEPALGVTEKVRSWQRWTYRAGAQANVCERELDEPAPTVGGFGHDAASHGWRSVAGWRVNTGRDWKAGGSREDAQQFDATTRPAPAVDGKGRWHVAAQWAEDRPATTVCGRPDVFPPGHKLNADDVRAGREGQRRSGGGSTDDTNPARSIRVSAREAAVLQSFPADYPWQGSKTAQFRQIGDAVPPMLARAVLEVLVSR
jgi:DNA (cytosine-5)-methyltransferase 1